MSKFTQWFKNPHNKELFETHVIPIVCEFNSRIIGGDWEIMFKPWAFEIAYSMDEFGISRGLITWHNNSQKSKELYPEYNWSRIALVFGLYGKLLKTKLKGLLSPELRQQIIEDQERIFKVCRDDSPSPCGWGGIEVNMVLIKNYTKYF